MSFQGTSRFEPLAHLGTGGMGSVYRVLDRQLGTEVALKTLLQSRGIDLLRFKREFRTLADLKHPNLVALYELIRDERLWYLTMEYVPGAPFHRYLWAGDTRQRGAHDGAAQAIAPTVRSLPGADTWPAATGPEPGGEAAADVPFAPVEPPDPSRLRPALLQLCRGVQALHEAGHVHRDLKPSNVLVTPEGRVVILDFGLAQALDAAHEEATELIGTPAFMAPEQVLDRKPQPASDWYAVGTMLYHALVGRPPFEGSLFELLAQKQWDVAPAPIQVSPGVDPALSALCMELLRTDPAARPTGPELLERLEEHRPRPRGAAERDAARPISVGPRAGHFVGRAEELDRMAGCFEETRDGRLRLCLLEGPSGIGKTGLAHHFLTSRVAAVGGGATPLLLHGRCHERESMPYKAFDAIVDELTDHLAGLDARTRRALLPAERGDLAEIFPVLRRLRDVGERTLTGTAVSENRARRSRAFRAFRALLRGLTRHQPVVILIDDLQWADTDSFALLEALVQEPGAPSLLLVATCRPVSEELPDTAARLARLRRLGCVTTLELTPLSPDATRELAETLLAPALPDEGLRARLALTVAQEAAGNPFFVAELVRYLQGLDATTWTSQVLQESDPLRLEQLVLRRAKTLPELCQRLLELVAVAGDPLPQGLLAEALQPAPTAEASKRAWESLQAAHLIRIHGLRTRDLVEPYHDRIREAVFASLSAGTRAGLHRRIATALERWPRARAHRLARHWLAAAAPEQARQHVLVAAGEAREMLAFARAARLYGTAVTLEDDPAARWKLQRAQAECLELSGRAVQAARVYADAAGGAPTAKALSLRQRAAEQHLRGGEIARGLDELGAVLAVHGLRMPPSARRAQLAVMTGLARLRLRGTRFRERSPAALSPAQRQRLDLLWAACIGLTLVDVLRADVFLLQFVQGALEAGDRRRVAQGLSLLAAHLASLGGPLFGWAHRLADEAESLAERAGDPNVLGAARMCQHVVRYFEGGFSDAADGLLEVERHFLERCHGVSWELATTRSFMCWAFRMSGRIRELVERVDRYVIDAERSGDVMAATNLRTYQSVVWLVRDDPERAAEEIADALDAWPTDLYQVQHFFHLYARCEQALYRERPRPAWEMLEAEQRQLSRSGLLKVSGVRLEHARIRGRVALAVAETLPPAERGPYLRAARRCARILGSGEHELAHAMGALLEAGARRLAPTGTTAAVREALERAVTIATGVPSALLAAAGRRRLGELAPIDDDRIAAADRWMTEQGVRNPARLTRLLVPGFDAGRWEGRADERGDVTS